MSIKITHHPLEVYKAYDASARSPRLNISVATDGLGHETRISFNQSPIYSSFYLTEEEAIALRDMLTDALPEMTAQEAA